MVFNKHLDLEGKHAFLGASNFFWIKDDETGLVKRLVSYYMPMIGTSLHEFAKSRIEYKEKLTKSEKGAVRVWLYEGGIPWYVVDRLSFDAIYDNLRLYINDAIGYSMKPEVILKYSDDCFGTADAISFNEKEKLLRIHDLKTGIMPAHMEQLLIYAALFCLEYKRKPSDLKFELRIYQGGNILLLNPSSEDINNVVKLAIDANRIIFKEKGGTIL